MTCIEFFDKESIEDICTCFAANADTVIFIGKDKKVMEKYILRLSEKKKYSSVKRKRL